MTTKEIPVLLLTGYLGSGKTTLVNHILANKQGIRFAVIVNDLGEVTIDADLIVKGNRGMGVLAGFFLGSVSTMVSQSAHCPVTIVK